jgi:hypothetical protein
LSTAAAGLDLNKVIAGSNVPNARVTLPAGSNVICPTSDYRVFLSSPFAKNISLPSFGNL